MKSRIFLISFIASFIFFCGVNVFSSGLENFLFTQEIIKNPQILNAQIAEQLFPEKKKRENVSLNSQIGELEIGAKAAISVWTGKGFPSPKVLFQKNVSEPLPVASLTKLMTAFVAIENYRPDQVIVFSDQAVAQKEDIGSFKTGDKFAVQDLLYSVLMESSNDAAYALSEVVGLESFADLMNLEAKHILGQNSKTFFANPTGLDSKENGNSNYSTAKDLADLGAYFLRKTPLIWDISSNSEFDLYSPEGILHHKILNTNELLGKIPGIVGGKTGETKNAGGCLIMVSESPNKEGFIVNVVLGSEDRFSDMEKLTRWIESAYLWPR